MKKILLMVIMALFVVSANAQMENLRWGVKAGMNVSNFGRDADTDARIGFHIGALAEYTLTDLISIQPELLLTLKGAKHYTPYYLELPINAKFNFPLGEDRVYLTVGPYIAYGLFGEGAISDRKFFKDDAKRFDFGGGIGAGYEFMNGLFLNLGFSYGFIDISDGFGEDINNMNFMVSVGYKF